MNESYLDSSDKALLLLQAALDDLDAKKIEKIIAQLTAPDFHKEWKEDLVQAICDMFKGPTDDVHLVLNQDYFSTLANWFQQQWLPSFVVYR